jgi:predicted AAA+ superfamily ATPase
VLDDYVEVFSNRDARELIAVDSPGRLEEFVRLTAAWTGQELNLSGLARDLGMPVSTVRRWLDVLQRSYLIDLVPPYSRNASQRVIKAPKLYAVDPALALAAARESEPTGFHLETLIANDLLVWRDAGAMRDRQLVPVEVKASQSVDAGEARHLRTFRERHENVPRGLVLSCDPEIRAVAEKIIACPWWAVL